MSSWRRLAEALGIPEAGPPPTDRNRRRDKTVGMRHHDAGLNVQDKSDNRAERYGAKDDIESGWGDAELETEAGSNWQKLNQKKNMQRYGTQDRRDKQSPMSYFNLKGTGSAQRQGTAAAAAPSMTPRPGGMQIPGGTDKPTGQPNPLMQPTKAPNAMARRTPGQSSSWVDALDIEDEEI